MDNIGQYLFHALFGVVGTIIIVFFFSVTKSNIEFENKAVEISGVVMNIVSYYDDE